MSEGFIGQIQPFGFGFAPRNWATCDGQILSIAQNTALFSLLGTTYGGNGQTTFALPDLRGRVPIHQGQGPGLSNYTLGEVGGSETTTLVASNLPPHTHFVNATNDGGNAGRPAAGLLASGTAPQYFNGTPSSTVRMAPNMIAPNTGGPQPFNNLQPFLVINFCICLYGVFPSRN